MTRDQDAAITVTRRVGDNQEENPELQRQGPMFSPLVHIAPHNPPSVLKSFTAPGY